MYALAWGSGRDPVIDAFRSLFIHCVVVPDCKELDGHLRQLPSFTHVAFTSKNGISAVMARLRQLHGSDEAAAEQLRGVSCWALGADAEMLRGLGLEVQTPPKVP